MREKLRERRAKEREKYVCEALKLIKRERCCAMVNVRMYQSTLGMKTGGAGGAGGIVKRKACAECDVYACTCAYVWVCESIMCVWCVG